MNTSLLSPYLNFSGNCQQAMEFYQSVLGGELEINRFGDYASPEMPVSDAQTDKVMHATLSSDDLTFMASDGQEGRTVVFGDSVSLSISGTNEEKLTAFFNGLSADGIVTMPLMQVPWGAHFGMFTDKFGINWMINIG
ncbi:MAG: VOC family protein [Candidatus Saccharimonadales bacterium]